MSASSPRREHLRVDPDALPDPRAWAPPASPFSGPLRRIVLYGAVAVGALALSAVALRSVVLRARSTASADLLGALPPLAVEGDHEARGKRAPTPDELAELNRSWIGSETISPRDAVVDRSSGEEVAPFHGFAVDVETAPSGARVIANGIEVGTAPILATVRCAPGERVELRAERGRARGQAATRCRKDARVRLRITLSAGR